VQNSENGQGLFVEHEGHSEDSVRHDISDSLGKLVQGRPDVPFGDVDMEVVGTTCVDHPVSALVIAIYETSSWASADLDIPIIGSTR
jgi:arginine decarboxylase